MYVDHASAWLPDSAIRDGRLTGALSSVVAAWLQDWFAAPHRAVVGADFGNATRRLGDGDVCWSADGVLLAISKRGLIQIGAAMSGAQTVSSRAEDEAILTSIGQAAANNLCTHLSGMLDAPLRIDTTKRAIANAARITWRFADCIAIELYATRTRLAQARKALSKPISTRARLGSRADALARQALKLAVLIGEARVGLQEVKDLAPGDVIVLDRSLGEDLDLTIAGRRATGLRCKLDREGAHMRLRLTQTPQAVSVAG